MSTYTAEVLWLRNDGDFVGRRYSRNHLLRFDGGLEVPGSASPHVVPLPMSDASALDPEEAFVASLASCHMLWFLSIAAQAGWQVEAYDDDAIGRLARDAQGRLAITQVTLRPQVQFGGSPAPDAAAIAAMHHEAHESCFIANSVRTDVRCLPILPT